MTKIFAFLKKVIAPIGITSGQIAIILTVLFFVFQILQTWLYNTPFKDSVFIIWSIPSIVSVSVGMFLISLFYIHNHKKNPSKIPPAEFLAQAIINYAEQLHKEGRDSALVSLRNNFSITLHILGFHNIRVKLGEIALKAATIIKDFPSKTEILIDDLGWANYLIHPQKDIAQKNIERGISIAENQAKTDLKNKERLSLCVAKGLRHMAIIDATNSDEHLIKAESTLKSLEKQSKRVVQIEYGQIFHAKALGNAMKLNINRSGVIRPNNDDDLKIVKESLELVVKAAGIFNEYGDLERYTKALFLHVRLLESIGENVEALEISALRDRTLAVSEWIRAEGTNTLIGK